MIFSRKTLPAWGVLIVGILLSLFVARQVAREIERDAAQELAFASNRIAVKIEERLFAYALILRSAAGFLSGPSPVIRLDWQKFVDALRVNDSVSGVQGVGYSELITPDRLAAHEARVRAEGFPQYKVWPQGARPVYSSIVFLEPFSGRNLRAFGYDMFSEPVRRAAMERARDTGNAAFSGKVELVQETGIDIQAGTLLYVPVYRPGLPTASVEQRRAALAGWTYSPYRMTDLMSGILLDWHKVGGEDFTLHIHDGVEKRTGANLLYGTSEHDHADLPDWQQQRRIIDFNGRQWALEFERSRSAPGLSYLAAWMGLAAGVVMSALLFALMLSLVSRRERAAELARQLTVDIQQSKQRLQESEQRWKFALEGSDLGVWDWNVRNNSIYFSPRWKEMLGYSEDDIGAQLDEWSSRVHPDDLQQTMAAVNAYLDGATPQYVSEHRVRCKDGSYKWILDRGMVIERAPDGKPLRMIGTHSNITARKLLEQELMGSEAILLEAQRVAQMGSWQLDLATGKVVWTEAMYQMLGLDPAGPPMDYPGYSKLFSVPDWAVLSAAIERTRTEGAPYSLEVAMIRPDGQHRWMLARGEAHRDAKGAIVEIHGVALDITARKEAQLRSERLSRLYAALSECSAAILHFTSQADLFDRICKLVVELGGMKMAWIGTVDEASGRVMPASSYGAGREYLDGIEISVHDDASGWSPTAAAIREDRPVWAEDFINDPRTAPWHERARRFGWASLAALPIRRDGRPVAALVFYSEAAYGFDDEIRRLLGEMAAQLSFALDKLDAEAYAERSRASLVESEERFRSLVEQSIAGAYITQNGRFVYVNPRLKSILGYGTDDDLLGSDALDVVAPKDRKRVGQLQKALIEGSLTTAHATFTVLRKDGSTTEVGVGASRATYLERPVTIAMVQDISDKQVAEDQIRRYAQQLEQVFMQTVALATSLSEMRDPYTSGHEKRVADIAVAIGAELGLDANRLEGLKVGGYLHDVGKTSIPAEILSKPGRLTDIEFNLIKGHAQASYDVLKDVQFPWPVAQIALQHHERIDGSGYPQGLKGDNILLEARIIAVADVVESMGSHRPYRPALGIDKALAEIERGRGTAFDPAVVDACLRLFHDKGFVLAE
jgi:PAS domain S-box-containing protein/putative nucleotidyltransferase with HDIG domain